MAKKITYSKLIGKIIFSILLLTVTLAYFYGSYVKTNTVTEISKKDGKLSI